MFLIVRFVKTNPQNSIAFTFSHTRNLPRSVYSCIWFELFQVLRIFGVQMAIFGTHSCLFHFLLLVYFKKEKAKKKNKK